MKMMHGPINIRLTSGCKSLSINNTFLCTHNSIGFEIVVEIPNHKANQFMPKMAL